MERSKKRASWKRRAKDKCFDSLSFGHKESSSDFTTCKKRAVPQDIAGNSNNDAKKQKTEEMDFEFSNNIDMVVAVPIVLTWWWLFHSPTSSYELPEVKLSRAWELSDS